MLKPVGLSLLLTIRETGDRECSRVSRPHQEGSKYIGIPLMVKMADFHLSFDF